MKIQIVNTVSLSQEKTLRQDFDYHQYRLHHADNYYSFKELFSIDKSDNISLDSLYEDFFYCEIGNVDKNGDIYPVLLNFSRRNLIDENYYKKIEKGDIQQADNDSILISKVRPNLKKYIRITGEKKNCYYTSAFIKIKPLVIPEILYYCFRNVFYDDLVAISRQGKGYPTLSENDLVTLRFDKSTIDKLISEKETLSPLIRNIEQKIEDLSLNSTPQTKIIDDIFDKRFGLDVSALEPLRTEKKFIVKNSFFSDDVDLRFSTKFHRNSAKFTMNKLSTLTDKKIKHFLAEPIILGASVTPEDYSDDGEYCYISMATIKNWKFDLESASAVSKEYSDSKLAKTVRKNDIILARSGEGTIGKVALIDDDEIQGVFADFTMRIRLKNYNPEFAYYYFRTTYFQYLIEIYKKGLGNNTNIFPIVVREFPMLDISLEEQQRIVDEIHAEIAKQDEIKNQVTELRMQIDKIIENAIVGR